MNRPHGAPVPASPNEKCLPRLTNRSKNIVVGKSRLMKSSSISRILLGFAAVLLLNSVSSAEVLKIVVNDTIQPITQEYIARAIDEAQRRNDQAILIEINTPGGLVESTRHIIEK